MNVSTMCVNIQWVVITLLLGRCSGYIYHLNASEYARMPPIFHLDPYDTCLQENNYSGVYCSVKFDLVTDEPSDLYTMMEQYTEKTEVHFNHTKLSYGICLTKTCNNYYEQNTTRDLVLTLEACLNETMWKNYKLKTRIEKDIRCSNLEEGLDINTWDIIVAALLVVLIVFNFVGSLQEVYLRKSKTSEEGNTFLSCFSISRNWRQLVKPAGEGPDPRFTRLKLFHGIKTISIMLVIMFHSILPYVVNLGNPQDIEEGYNLFHYQIIANGTVVVQSFFVISGFLISYNMQGFRKTTWISIPLAIMRRWMRLTPPYLVVLAVTATWMRYLGSGPLWQTVVISEVKDCQQNWWYHLLYINNYVDYNQCLLHSWYIAADFQLFSVGVLVFELTCGRKRNLVFILLFVFGLLAPAAHTYLQDLHGVLLVTPEASRDFFVHDPTFNNSYKRGHTNVASFTVGMTLGMLIYHWQTTSYKLHRFLTHRFSFWLAQTIPFVIVLLGSVFYRDAPRDSVYIRMLYAAFAKPLWAMWLSYFIIGIVFRFEDTVRGLFEWDGWTVPSRVSYCTYLLHMILIRVSAGTKRSVMHFSVLNLLETVASTITLSFLAAIPFYLLAEAPFLQLFKIYTPERKKTGSNQMVAGDPFKKTPRNENKDEDEEVKEIEKTQTTQEDNKCK